MAWGTNALMTEHEMVDQSEGLVPYATIPSYSAKYYLSPSPIRTLLYVPRTFYPRGSFTTE